MRLAAAFTVDRFFRTSREELPEAHALGPLQESCEAKVGPGADAIEHARLNDLANLLRLAPTLQAIVHNGGESARAMAHTRALGVAVLRLPSTSPANASWSFARKVAAWRAAFDEHGMS